MLDLEKIKIKSNEDIVRFETILSQLLELDEKQLKSKLNYLAQALVYILSQNKTIYIKGVGSFEPKLLQPGVHLSTRDMKKINVGPRFSVTFKTTVRFKQALKSIGLKNYKLN